MVESRLGFWLPFVSLALLALTGILMVAYLRSDHSTQDDEFFLAAQVAAMLLSGLSYGWYRQARLIVYADGTIVARNPFTTKTLDLRNLVRVTVQPQRRPAQMRGPGYKFRLIDVAGNTLKVPQMYWHEEGRIFSLVSDVARPAVADEITREALAALAERDDRTTSGSAPKAAAVLLLTTIGVSLAAGLAARVLNEVIPSSRDRCEQVDQITENLARDPGPLGAGPPDLGTQWTTLSPLLLRNPGKSYRFMDEGPSDYHLPGAGNAERLELLTEHGYVGEVIRYWTTPTGTRLEHKVIGFSSPQAAEAYEAEIVTDICRFANRAWIADLPLPQGGSTLGVGLQLRHRAAEIVEHQFRSWDAQARDQHRSCVDPRGPRVDHEVRPEGCS